MSNLQTLYPQGIQIPPTQAAVQYNAPLGPLGQPGAVTVTYNQSGFLPLNIESLPIPAGFTLNSGNNLIVCPGAPASSIQWVGLFEYTPQTGYPPTIISTRRWTCGFEVPEGGDFLGSSTSNFSRDSSRTIDGKGWPLDTNTGLKITLTNPQNYGGTYPTKSWERVYLRLRTLPSGEDEFWSINGNLEGTVPVVGTVATNGQLNFYNVGNNGFPGTLLGSYPAIAKNIWYKIDILLSFAYNSTSGGRLIINPGTFSVYVNGLQALYAQIPNSTGTGLGVVQLHVSSTLGNLNSGDYTPAGLEIDTDDWIASDFPPHFGVYDPLNLNVLTNGPDFLYGMHVRPLLPVSFGSSSSPNWAGDYRFLGVNPVADAEVAYGVLASSTANAVLEVVTDYTDVQIGCTALTTSVYTYSSASVTTNLGYEIGSPNHLGPPQILPVTVATGTWSIIFNSFSNGISPTLTRLGGLNLYYQKDNSAGTQYITALQGTATYIGIWGPEDAPPGNTVVYPPRIGIHNAPYPNSQWANLLPTTPMPAAPVQVLNGTYVGNGVGQDIIFTSPIHWFWCRPITAASPNAGIHWWSSMAGSHGIIAQSIQTNRISRMQELVNGNYQMSLAGSSPESNALGVTYQWIAMSDPGARFILNGAFTHDSSVATYTNALADSGFTPLAAFLFLEDAGLATHGHFYKGPGNTTSNANLLDAGEVAGVATLGTGGLITLTGIHGTIPDTAYSAWRLVDAAGVTGPIAITSYIGDGTGTKVINLALQGAAPVFALVAAHNRQGCFRDLSHTGTTSTDCSTGAILATDSIMSIATPNQMTIGTTINANGIVYDVFALTSFQVPTIPTAPITPNDTGGWWASTNDYTSPATIITPPTTPLHGRQWNKLVPFAQTTSGMLGGAPGAAVTIENQLIYAGDDYSLGSTFPTIHTFGPFADRLLTTVPSYAPLTAAVPLAIVSMLAVGNLIYFSTLDSGTTHANFAGRVFSFDPLSLIMTLIGTGIEFATGEVPYALEYHMNRVWCGTNHSTGVASNIYYFRPNIDTKWTLAYSLATSSAGGCCSLHSFNGNLYVGTDNTAASAGLMLSRSPVGVYTTVNTGAGTDVNNGYLSTTDFKGNLYTSYWTSSVGSTVIQYNPTANTWTPILNGNSPIIAIFVAQNVLFALGGGNKLEATLAYTTDGVTWVNATPFLSGPITETSNPLFGLVGP